MTLCVSVYPTHSLSVNQQKQDESCCGTSSASLIAVLDALVRSHDALLPGNTVIIWWMSLISVNSTTVADTCTHTYFRLLLKKARKTLLLGLDKLLLVAGSATVKIESSERVCKKFSPFSFKCFCNSSSKKTKNSTNQTQLVRKWSIG